MINLQIGHNFIFEFSTPNRFSASSCSKWTSGLYHKTFDDSMEDMTIVISISSVNNKVLHSFRHFIFEKLEIDIALRRTKANFRSQSAGLSSLEKVITKYNKMTGTNLFCSHGFFFCWFFVEDISIHNFGINFT